MYLVFGNLVCHIEMYKNDTCTWDKCLLKHIFVGPQEPEHLHQASTHHCAPGSNQTVFLNLRCSKTAKFGSQLKAKLDSKVTFCFLPHWIAWIRQTHEMILKGKVPIDIQKFQELVSPLLHLCGWSLHPFPRHPFDFSILPASSWQPPAQIQSKIDVWSNAVVLRSWAIVFAKETSSQKQFPVRISVLNPISIVFMAVMRISRYANVLPEVQPLSFYFYLESSQFTLSKDWPDAVWQHLFVVQWFASHCSSSVSSPPHLNTKKRWNAACLHSGPFFVLGNGKVQATSVMAETYSSSNLKDFNMAFVIASLKAIETLLPRIYGWLRSFKLLCICHCHVSFHT